MATTSVDQYAVQPVDSAVVRSRPPRRFQPTLGVVLWYVAMIAIALLFLLPFLIVVSTSLKTPEEVYSWPPTLIPQNPTLENYTIAFAKYDFARMFGNSLLVAGARVAGILFFNSLVAYSFARLTWPGRDVWFLLLMVTMILPGEVTLIPLFRIFKDLGLLGSFWPLILPRWIGSPFLIFLMRQFFKGIPDELSDAARIDGASELQIYYRVVLPLSLPVMATCVLYEFGWAWNDFMGPLIYLNDSSMYTLPVGLNKMANEAVVNWGAVMATGLLTMLPIAAVFLTLQRYFVENSAVAGIKG